MAQRSIQEDVAASESTGVKATLSLGINSIAMGLHQSKAPSGQLEAKLVTSTKSMHAA